MKRYFFLARYYLANILFVKLGGIRAKRLLPGWSHEWGSIKEKFAGPSEWLVVGNGPSLSGRDLSRLSHLPSIASNKINLIFGDTTWRPSIYTIVDALVLTKLTKDHYEELPSLLTSHRGYYLSKARRKTPWRLVFADDYLNWVAGLEGVPDPVNTGFLDGYTITTANIQIAMWLGAKTIYLIGCDHFYREEASESVKKLAHTPATTNHFHASYRTKGEIVNNAPVARMEEGYSRMRRLAERNGIRIINISRKTALEVFEKGDIEQVAAPLAGAEDESST